MSSTTYLITGANRGLGKGLVEVYISRPDTTVIAAVRDPANTTAKALNNLSKGKNSKLIIVKIDSTSTTDPADAVKELQTSYQIPKIDVVIANAGISDTADFGPVTAIKIPSLNTHIAVNAIGPLVLFQAVSPLLEKSAQPKFAVVGSPLGSIGGMEERPYPCSVYGISKAIANYLVRKIHFENTGLTSFVIDPGFVQTDMGNTGARFIGMEKAFTTVQESVDGMVTQIDGASREKTSGHFLVWTGEEFPW